MHRIMYSDTTGWLTILALRLGNLVPYNHKIWEAVLSDNRVNYIDVFWHRMKEAEVCTHNCQQISVFEPTQ
jgi:hypothetical protein